MIRRLPIACVFALLSCAPDPNDGRDWVEPVWDTIEQAVIDCAERQDTGYVRGEPFQITVVTVDGKPVERETANAYWVMQQAAARDGVNIRISSGFRTNAEQQRLYNCYRNCNCNNCNLAARPGYSNHQSGHALDLNTHEAGVLNWLNNNGAAFGFARTVPSENWHWEWWGGGPGGGPCDGEPCEVLPAAGGVLDDDGRCFQANGPAQFWRHADGVGHGGSLQWTNAFASGEPSNWGRWNIHLDQAGRYTVEVATGGQWGVWERTRYKVRHDGQTETVELNQSLDGWQALGDFEFAAGGEQWVDVFDNYEAPVPADQHIAADAIRITPWMEPEPEPEPEEPAPEEPEPEPEEPAPDPEEPDPVQDPPPEEPVPEKEPIPEDHEEIVPPESEDPGLLGPEAGPAELDAGAPGFKSLQASGEAGCSSAPGASPLGLLLLILGFRRRR